MIRRPAAACVVIAALAGLLPAAAVGHGEHGTAKPLGATGAVTVLGYQVELLADPAPLLRSQQSQVVAKVFRNPAQAPVSGGKVLMAVERPAETAEPRAAAEITWAGSYGIPFTPAQLGPHRVRVLLEELEGRRFAPALVVEFPVHVGLPPGMGTAMWILVALVGGATAAGLYLIGIRARRGLSGGEALNLLAIGWVRRLLTSPAFQPALQVPLLLLMAIVIVLGLSDTQNGAVNVATRLTWTIWWAGIIFTFVLLGRVWCVACPFGALNEWASRLTAPARRLPRPLRNLWWATGMFVLLTWADEQLGIVRAPLITAWIVLFFGALAVAVGLFFARRSFCRYLCPIGGLIGIYSMAAPVELRAASPQTCAADREQGCYRGHGAGRGCPMFEFPQTMDRNNYCTLCGECIKGCARDNLALRFRAFGKDLWSSRRWMLDESYLAVALVGLTLVVTAEMLTAWPDWIAALARWLPEAVRASLKPVTYLSLTESVILLGGTLLVAPLLVLAGCALARRLAGGAGLGLRRSFAMFGYMFVPVGLGLHLAHNLAHLLLEGGAIVPAVQRAVHVYTPWSLGEPDWEVLPLAPEPVVGLVQVGILVGFFVLSLVAGHRLALRAYPDPGSAARAFVPMAALSFAFTVAALVLLSQPMGMRHAM